MCGTISFSGDILFLNLATNNWKPMQASVFPVVGFKFQADGYRLKTDRMWLYLNKNLQASCDTWRQLLLSTQQHSRPLINQE